MLHLLKRHPVAVRAFFRHSLVLTYAFPQRVLQPLLPPGLVLDTYEDFGFLAIALVQTQGLRPDFLPRWMGQDFFLSGYRIFTRLGDGGSSLRGLRILRSDTDKRSMVITGNWLTHYRYEQVRVALRLTQNRLDIEVKTANGEADLHVMADLATAPALPPAGSPFPDLQTARKFAGPLPYTFDYEPQTQSIIRVRGIREHWDPQPVTVDVRRCAYLDREPFRSAPPLLANAFYLRDVPYRWERGTRVKVS